MNRKTRPRWFIRALPFLPVFSLTLIIQCAGPSKIPNLSTISPRDIQLKIEKNFNKLQNFRGKARVILERPGKGYRGFASVFMKLPDSVFVKTEAILGIDIGALFLDHRFFAAYAPRDNILYYGEVETLDLRDFLEVEVSTDELYEVFSGLNKIEVNAFSRLEFSDGKFVVTTPSEKGSLIYRIDPRKFVVLDSELVDSNGELLLHKEYRRLRKRDGIQLPQIIKLTRPQTRERITVFYTSQTINKKISTDEFRVRPAKNAQKVYWGDVSNPALDKKN